MIDFFAVVYSEDFFNMLFDIFLFFALFALIISVFIVTALWKIFKKAGYEGWESLIPIYNVYILTKICGLDGWFAAIILIPGIGTIIWEIVIAIKLSAAFNKDGAFAIGLVLLPLIFYPILGFSNDAHYVLGGQNHVANPAQQHNNPYQNNTYQNNPQPQAPYVAPRKPEDPWLSGQ